MAPHLVTIRIVFLLRNAEDEVSNNKSLQPCRRDATYRGALVVRARQEGGMGAVAVLETMVRIPGERLRGNCVDMLQHEGHAPLQISALFGSGRS